MTLKEVAKLAGVSPSAVSRYLNGGPLSQAKSASIRRVIERTGYFPNQAAHTLRTGRVKQVGVIVPRIHSEAVSKVTAGIAEALDQEGYLPVLGISGRESRREARYLDMMRAYHVAGVILMATSEELADLYRTSPVPLVVTGQRLPGLPCVFHDDFHAMTELAARLLDRGRRRLCYIGVSQADPAVGRERLRGAREALRGAGLDPDAMPVETAGFDWETGYRCMHRLLNAYPETDGVLCATDTIAQGALLALREAERRVPQDVSLAGIGDDWADLVSVPPLTTAQLDQTRCGREAAEMLLRLMAGGEPEQRMLEYTIVDRGSI